MKRLILSLILILTLTACHQDTVPETVPTTLPPTTETQTEATSAPTEETEPEGPYLTQLDSSKVCVGIIPTQEPASIKIHLLLVESINLNNNNSNQFLSTFYVPITILNTSCASPRILLLQFFQAVTILIYVFVCKKCFNNTMQTGCFNKKKSVSQGSGG